MMRDPADILSDNFSKSLSDFANSGQTSLFIQTVNGTPTHNLTDKDGNTFLHLAVMSGASDLIAYLLSLKYNPTKKNNKGLTPAALAATTTLKNKWEMVKVLCVKAINNYPSNVVVDSENNTLLHLAVQSGNCALISYLLERGCDPKLKNNAGLTPAALAAQIASNNKWQIVNLFVEFKQDEDAIKYGFNKALLCAVKDNNYIMAKKLLENGAMAQAELFFDDTGNGYLHEAVKNKNIRMIELLLEYHADMTLENKEGLTPVTMASSKAKRDPAYADVYLAILNYESNRCHRTSPKADFLELKKSLKKSLSEYCGSWFVYNWEWVHHHNRAVSFSNKINKLKSTDDIIELLKLEIKLFEYKTIQTDIRVEKYLQIPQNHTRDGFNHILNDYLELFERLKVRESLEKPLQVDQKNSQEEQKKPQEEPLLMPKPARSPSPKKLLQLEQSRALTLFSPKQIQVENPTERLEEKKSAAPR